MDGPQVAVGHSSGMSDKFSRFSTRRDADIRIAIVWAHLIRSLVHARSISH